MPFEHLLKPGLIRSMEVPNRVVMAPMCTELAAPDGSVTEAMLEYYKERARGHTGLIIVEFAFIDSIASKSTHAQIGAHNDGMVPGLNRLAESMQAYGSKAGLQIAHCGAQKIREEPPCLSASALSWEPGRIQPREATIEEIEGIVDSFGKAAARAKRAGFDFVEIHGSHGYLITCFLSPLTNRRTDKYGGNLEGRLTFPLEIVRRVREAVGPDFPIGFRMNGTDHLDGGITLEEAKETARQLRLAGVDLLHISAGMYRSRDKRITPMYMPKAYNVYLAEAIRKVVDVPVVASGGINDPELADDIIRTGKADYVSLARQLFADPYWAKKIEENRPEDICPCIRCNDGCLARVTQGKSVWCTVNASAGRETEYRITPSAVQKKVLIVGGGPAGMEAARILTLRGHKVTLWEKTDQLGGSLIDAAVPDFKEDLRGYLRYLKTQVSKLKIEVVLGKEADANAIKAISPDAVIFALGAEPIKPDIPGIERPNVTTAIEVLRGTAQLGQRVIVVGGGFIGSEVAWHLASKGKKVVITTRQPDIALDLEGTSRVVVLRELKKLGVEVVRQSHLEEVTAEGIELADSKWNRRSIVGDSVVLASGFKSRRALVEQVSQMGIPAYAIGDCVCPGKIGQAIHQAAHVACEI